MKRPAKCITIDKARKLQKKWRDTRGKFFEENEDYQDSCEVWYSLDELQEYLNYVRDLSAEQGVEHPGISIWFGAEDSKGKQDGLSTIFLMATKETSESENAVVQNESGKTDVILPLSGSSYELNESIDGYNDGSTKWPPSKI
ncbi:hypothetical protein MKO06_07785 [Gramella sp. GC03-9]|uniref:Uncharacterized protein n=1 Tax=Christiangramia oceanisediminis TaxID=2920386 RepID=A0A9X2KWE8_9FLAO|nr:hypothetical protein [Gramella oceanisediminis]MCP9199800.1 hypothetical protein [Gramella oceanisediminis]